ncbi:hypothetical protein HUO09_17050 [Vibrio sp. Y2-5]|uniref:hypothetical protein n=1 Tax=Vibrio sp. Y2-5 TaxID=2743977 RepID=UPI0016615429|nr:hypothetical protein [Vibrio sp. Y2-5]MBD0788064.1 hypothetical protein [Vibrio sp. Y2-5]
MRKKQKGLALIDLLMSGAVYVALISMGTTFIYSTFRPYLDNMELEDYSVSLFRGMEQYYWDHVIDTRCIQPPSSIDLQTLIDGGYVSSKLSSDSFFEGTNPKLSFHTTADNFFPTSSQLEVNVKSVYVHSLMKARFFNSTESRNFDESAQDRTFSSVITLIHPMKVNDLTPEFLSTINTSNCGS